MSKIEPRKKDIMDYAIPILGIIIALYLSLHMAMAYEVVKDDKLNRDYVNEAGEMVENRAFNFGAFFSQVGKQLSEEAGNIKFVESTPKFILGAGFVSLMIIGYIATSQKKFINGKEYGTSEWAGKKQLQHLNSQVLCKNEIKKIKKSKLSKQIKEEKIKEVKEKYKTSDIIFTQTERICMYNYELNNNTLIIGGSGSGKTRGYVLPNILQCSEGYSPSLVITDPKGEILSKIGSYLTKCGYEIKVLNLKEQDKSFCFNPFRYILDDKFEEQISSLVSCIMDSSNTKKDQSPNDTFWIDMSKLLLKSLFYAVYEGFPVEERNMTTVMEMFRWFEINEDDDRVTNPTKLDDFFKVFGENEEIKKKYGDVNKNPALRSWEDFRSKCKGKPAQSVISVALSKLAPFDEEQIRRIFSKDELELDLVGERKTAVFIILPPTTKTYNFVANVLYVQLFYQLEYCATVLHDQKLPVPVRFILDEFYNTGRIPDFENILSYARSFGIGISIILQSLDQIKEMYEKSWGTIVDTCNTFLYLGGVRHPDTLEYISKLLGKGTFDKKSYSRTKGKQSSSSTSFDKIGRELLDPAEIQRLDKKKCLLFVSGYQPYLSNKFNYTTHKNYKFTSDFNKSNTFIYEEPHIEEEIKEVNITHGEELPKRAELISIKENSEDTMKYLQENLLNLEIDGTELLNDDDDTHIIEKIIQEDKELTSSFDEIMRSELIEIKSDINEVLDEFVNNKEIIDYDEIQINEDESIENMELFDIDLEDIESSINSLKEDMIDEGFLNDLNDVDLEVLPTS